MQEVVSIHSSWLPLSRLFVLQLPQSSAATKMTLHSELASHSLAIEFTNLTETIEVTMNI